MPQRLSIAWSIQLSFAERYSESSAHGQRLKHGHKRAHMLANRNGVTLNMN